MSNPALSEKLDETPKPSRWPKRLVIGGLILLPIVALVSVYSINVIGGSWALREAFDEADRLDPGWRLLDDLEAKRAVIPDAENSARHIMDVLGNERTPTALYPHKWPSDELTKLLENLEPTAQLDEKQVKALRDDVNKVTLAVTELRKLADMPRGRYPIDYGPDPMMMLLPHVQTVRTTVNMLTYEALLLAQEGKIDEALVSCRASLNAGRSLGDEPIFISVLVRIACDAIAIHQIERVLAQGQASEAELAALQKLLEDEAQQPLLLNGARGERAAMDRALQNTELSGMSLLRFAERMSATTFGAGDQWFDVVKLYTVSMKKQRAELMKFNNQVVEIAKMPIQKQRDEFGRLEATARDLPVLARLMTSAISKIGVAHHRSVATVHCAATALAAERYRLAHGKWPDKLEQLIPKYLSKVPDDPFSKDPIKFRRLADSIVIYSVAQNGRDDGGNLDRKTGGYASNTDIGFQLWDVAKRRQSPTTKQPMEPKP